MQALRARNFRLYWFGQAISNIGNWMQTVALGWFVLQIGGSPLTLGFLGLVQFVPIAVLSLIGGVLADRFLRLRLLLVTQSLSMFLATLLALLAWLGRPPFWSLLLIAGLAATVIAVDNPARQAFLSDLVPGEAVLQAVSLNASVYNGAAVIGPSLAGLLLVHVGVALCFSLNALSFLVVVIALLLIDKKRLVLDRKHVGAKVIHVRAIRRLKTPGQLRIILVVLTIAATVSLLGRPYLLLLPAFARDVQRVGAQGLGVMVAASGLGSLVGAIFLASLRSSQPLKPLLLLCCAEFGIALTLFAGVPGFQVTLPLLLCCGAGATMTMMVANSWLQTAAPPDIRGRIMSLYTLIAAGFSQLGALLISGAAIWIGLEHTMLLAGLGVIFVILPGYLLLR